MDYGHKCYKSAPFSTPISLTDTFVLTYISLHAVAMLLFLHLLNASICTNIRLFVLFCFVFAFAFNTLDTSRTDRKLACSNKL